MLEYNIRTEDERLEELQNGIKSLAKYSDKDDLTTDFLQSRMQEVTYLGMDNLDEAVGQMLLEKLEEKINEITTTESISIKDLFDKREIEDELLNNESRMPEGYSNEVILFAFRNNPSALIEEVARLTKETLVEKIDKMNNSDNVNLDDIGIEGNVRNELINESRFPEGYSNEIILYAIKNNYSALYEEIGNQVDETYDSEMINEELSEIYNLGIRTMITDIANDYNLDINELSLGDLKEVVNTIDMSILNDVPTYDEMDIEMDKADYNLSKEDEIEY